MGGARSITPLQGTALPPERARADAREPFSGAAARCLYHLTLTRFIERRFSPFGRAGRARKPLPRKDIAHAQRA
jgi:hypothetical protein